MCQERLLRSAPSSEELFPVVGIAERFGAAGRVVDSAPAMFPLARQVGKSSPRRYECRNPASKLSPAPTVSMGSISRVGLAKRSVPHCARDPLRPSFTTTSGTNCESLWMAASMSSVPAALQASRSFGRNTSTLRNTSLKPSSQRSSGSSLVSSEMVRPFNLRN